MYCSAPLRCSPTSTYNQFYTWARQQSVLSHLEDFKPKSFSKLNILKPGGRQGGKQKSLGSVQYSNSPSNFEKQTKQPQKDSQFPIHLPHHQEWSSSAPADCLHSNLWSYTGLSLVLCRCRMKSQGQRWQCHAILLLPIAFNETKKCLRTLFPLLKTKKKKKMQTKSFLCPSQFKLNQRKKQQLMRCTVITSFIRNICATAADAASLEDICCQEFL